jgi:hypothetical protein
MTDTVTPHQIAVAAMRLAIEAGVPVVLIGPPGAGKTAAVNEVARGANRHLATIIASLREPSDFCGLPIVEGRATFMAPPAWARACGEHPDPIVFFDEVSTSPQSVQAALLRVVDEGEVGEFTLPRPTSFVAAMNPPDTAAGGWDLAPAFANRWLHIQWVGWSAAEWAAWVRKQGWGDAARIIGAFLLARPTLLHAMPKEQSARGNPWPSHRTWARAAKVLHLHMQHGGEPADSVACALVAGAVGEAASLEYAQYARELDLPNPAELIAHPERWVVPSRSDRIWATVTSVIDYALAGTASDWERGWAVLARCLEPDANGVTHGDVAVAASGDYANKRPAGAKIPVGLASFIPLLQKAGLMDGGGK